MGWPFLRSWLVASAAGVPVLIAFFVWHWFTIRPVWTVLVEGAVGVALAGAAVAWAWRRSRRAGRFAPPWGGVAFGGVFAGGILAAEALGLARGARPNPSTLGEVLVELPFALVPAVLVAAAGWRLAAGWRGALAYGLASLVLLLYLGGSIVQRGGVGLELGLFAILVPGYLVAGAIVGFADAAGLMGEPAPHRGPAPRPARTTRR